MKKLLSTLTLLFVMSFSCLAGDIPGVPGPPPDCTGTCLMATEETPVQPEIEQSQSPEMQLNAFALQMLGLLIF